MITTLTGSNGFALKAALDQLVGQFIKDYSDLGLERLDGEEVEFDQIRKALESLPFLASKKMVVLRSPSAHKEFVAQVEQLLTNVADITDVIIYEPKLDKRSSYFKFLQKHTEFKEFNELDEHSLAKWLVEQARGQGAALQSSDAKYMVERLGTNQQLLSNELTKLILYNSKITRESIDLLTEPTSQSTIFQLLDAAFAGNRKKLLQLYSEQRAAKIEPQAIIALLAWQLHVLAVLLTAGKRSDTEIAGEAKINPYVLRKSRQIANKLTLSKLKRLVGQLLDLDIKTKSTALDADDALQAFLLEIGQ